jgi:hypothetical protein
MGLLNKTASALMILAAVTIIACGKKDNNPSPVPSTIPANVATVPLSANSCFQAVNNPTAWNPYQNYGFQTYNPFRTWQPGGQFQAQWGAFWVGGYAGMNASLGWPSQYINTISGSGFCGCQPGFQPVCDATQGMICMPTYNTGYQMASWGYNGSAFRFNGYGGYNQYGCSNTVGQTCTVGYNTCGMGVCAPVQAGSPIGVCVRTY